MSYMGSHVEVPIISLWVLIPQAQKVADHVHLQIAFPPPPGGFKPAKGLSFFAKQKNFDLTIEIWAEK